MCFGGCLCTHGDVVTLMCKIKYFCFFMHMRKVLCGAFGQPQAKAILIRSKVPLVHVTPHV